MGGRTSGTRKGNGPGHPGSTGDGWGGEAKGASAVSQEHTPFQPGNTMNTLPRNPDRAAVNAARADELMDNLYRLATKAEREETQVSATTAWMNRVQGMPIARNVNVNADDLSALDDAALEQRRADVAAKLAAIGRGSAPESDPA